MRRDLLASIRQQGTYAGKLYGIGTFDSGLGLYVRPSVLEKAGIRIPRLVDDAWTSDEFTDVLRTLREAGHRTPVDIGLVHAQPGEEWNTYGFAPAVWSAGGDLIEPRTFRIIDIRMPPDHSTEGLKAARTIRERHPGTGILVLSAFVEVEDALELLPGGRGVGYLLKSRVTVVDEFIEALDRVGKGGAVVDPSLVHELFTAQRRDDPLSHLSSREREVLALMAEGRSNAGIGRRLWVTEGTVEKHVRSILGKLGLTEDTDDHRRVLAVLTFLESR
ncbi:LuxR C-terminal-related transcriptional regulator [Streptomyces sp. NPDC001652]|uniref:LuxR C-terminal-related transcriptional regulator n=1 Tax=Streptomyces sp. NPDC001652 TaxID=3154393 RepID=UPI003327F157